MTHSCSGEFVFNEQTLAPEWRCQECREILMPKYFPPPVEAESMFVEVAMHDWVKEKDSWALYSDQGEVLALAVPIYGRIEWAAVWKVCGTADTMSTGGFGCAEDAQAWATRMLLKEGLI